MRSISSISRRVGLDKEAVHVGIDLSLTELDVGVLPHGEVKQVADSPEWHSILIERLATLSPIQIILDTTESAAAEELVAARMPVVVVVNPGQAVTLFGHTKIGEERCD